MAASTPDAIAGKKITSRWARSADAAPEVQAAQPGAVVEPPALAPVRPPIPRHKKPKKGPRLLNNRMNKSIAVPLRVGLRLQAFLDKTNLNFSAWVVRLIELDMDARGFPQLQIGEKPL